MENQVVHGSKRLKSFRPSQEVYVVYLYMGRNKKPVIVKRIVEKVGRKYVTDNFGHRYAENPDLEDGLKEDSTYGTEGYLFTTQVKAEEFIEKQNLEIWLANLKPYGKFSLQQLRHVKAILDGEV